MSRFVYGLLGALVSFTAGSLLHIAFTEVSGFAATLGLILLALGVWFFHRMSPGHGQ